MNARLLYRLMLLAILASVFCITALGQQTASVTWNLVAPDSARPSTIVGQLDADTISGSNFVIANYGGTPVGPMGVNYMRWYPGNGVSWGSETAEVTNRYIQLSVSPKPGNSFTTDSITFWSAGGGTGNMKANFYASSDPTFTTKTMLNTGGDVALPQNTVGPARYAYGVQTTVNSGQMFYFRIYPWYTGSASTSKYVYTQLAVIKGTTTSSTSVDDHAGAIVPSAFSLEQNYPNPFNPSTEIRYQVPVAANVSLKVYNLLGLEVATIAKGVQQAGIHVARWDATGMPSGVYFYKIEAGSYARTLKMVLQK